MGSFFKKPAWAAKPAVTNDEFYRKSEQTYSDIIAASKAHKKSQLPPEKVESNEIIEKTPPGEDKPAKRVRRSDESPKKEIVVPTVSPSKSQSPEEHHASSTTTGNNADTPSSPLPAIENAHLQTSSLPAPGLPLTVEPADAERSINKQSTQHPRTIPTTNNNDPQKAHDSEALPASAQTLASPVLATSDPAVEILITSEIPNTKPLLVRRKMSQGLREVRLAWCKRQGLATGTQSQVYLTWKGRRLFDVTTCKSLAIKRDSTRFSSFIDDDLMEDQELRIHMVAVTDDPLLKNQSSASKDLGDQPPTSPGPKIQHAEDDEPMRLIFRSPGFNDLKVKARPKTLVSKLISTFREKQNVSADQAVFFMFDGDRLEPSACLRDYDIADLDLVDVQIQPHS